MIAFRLIPINRDFEKLICFRSFTMLLSIVLWTTFLTKELNRLRDLLVYVSYSKLWILNNYYLWNDLIWTSYFTCVFEAGTLYLRSSVIVSSWRTHGDVLTDRGRDDLQLVTLQVILVHCFCTCSDRNDLGTVELDHESWCRLLWISTSIRRYRFSSWLVANKSLFIKTHFSFKKINTEYRLEKVSYSVSTTMLRQYFNHIVRYKKYFSTTLTKSKRGTIFIKHIHFPFTYCLCQFVLSYKNALHNKLQTSALAVCMFQCMFPYQHKMCIQRNWNINWNSNELLSTVSCRYNTVQCNVIFRTALRWRKDTIKHISRPHSRAIGCFLWWFWRKLTALILHCIVYGTFHIYADFNRVLVITFMWYGLLVQYHRAAPAKRGLIIASGITVS